MPQDLSQPSKKSASGAVLTILIIQAALVVTGPLIARMLGPADRGRYALVILVPSVLSQLGVLGLPRSMTYHLATGFDEASIRARVARREAMLAAGLPFVSLVFAMALLRENSAMVIGSAVIASASIPFHVMLQHSLAVLLGRQQYFAHNVLITLPVIIYALGIATSFLLGVDTLSGAVIAWVLGFTLGGLAAGAFVRNVPPRLGGKAIGFGDIATYGRKGLLGTSSPVEQFRIDQGIAGLVLTHVQLGYYSVGLAFSNMPRFLGMGVGLLALPQVAEAQKRGTAVASSAARRYVLWSALVCGFAAAGLCAVTPWILPLAFGEEFRAAISVTQWLIVAGAVFGARRTLVEAAGGMGKPGLASTVEVVALIVLIPAMLIFGQRFGTVGAGIGLFASAVVSLGFGLNRLQRIESEPGDLADSDAELSEMPIKSYSREAQATGYESAEKPL
ncbi:MAG: lipopolysaccharide biosynthesis protein [Actinobacteria bacterium]|nr:lipopolysaccharide biosynthesis protein [Actinomycetota bacterium]MCB9389915.1 lipopolysaccharide biosynthesis protein [Acidimicrobiia bacterium]